MFASCAARMHFSSAPRCVLSLIPTTWLLAPSYHFPPFSWGERGLSSCGPPCLVTDLSYCSVCRGAGGGKGKPATCRARGKAVPDVIHHQQDRSFSSSLPIPFRIPEGGNCAVAIVGDQDEIRLPAIACGSSSCLMLCESTYYFPTLHYHIQT